MRKIYFDNFEEFQTGAGNSLYFFLNTLCIVRPVIHISLFDLFIRDLQMNFHEIFFRLKRDAMGLKKFFKFSSIFEL